MSSLSDNVTKLTFRALALIFVVTFRLDHEDEVSSVSPSSERRMTGYETQRMTRLITYINRRDTKSVLDFIIFFYDIIGELQNGIFATPGVCSTSLVDSSLVQDLFSIDIYQMIGKFSTLRRSSRLCVAYCLILATYKRIKNYLKVPLTNVFISSYEAKHHPMVICGKKFSI